MCLQGTKQQDTTMADFTTNVYISGKTFSEFEVEALFKIETASGSTSGDTVTITDTWATSWELIHINMDGFKINRSTLLGIIGKHEMRRIEDAACDEFFEKERAA
jgi:hypothetical protein